MPRFYFDVIDGARPGRDDEGLEFESIDAARKEAVLTLGQIAKESLAGEERRSIAITIRDDDSRPLFKASLTFQAETLS